MRAITVVPGQQGSVALMDVPEPPPGDGPVLVQAQAIGICGTDLEIINGEYGWAPPGQERLIIGHESLGQVAEAPPGSGFAVGDLVVGIVRRPDPVPGLRGRGLGHVHQREVHRAGDQGPARLRL
jgi:threonine dehydrogenase-like Zn-dependent dehydrogenase